MKRDECGDGNKSTKLLAFYTARTGVFGAAVAQLHDASPKK